MPEARPTFQHTYPCHGGCYLLMLSQAQGPFELIVLTVYHQQSSTYKATSSSPVSELVCFEGLSNPILGYL